jgi:preprotein translocase subunit SecY
MFGSLRNIFKIPELRKRIFFTLGILIVYRLGGHISSPGINAGALQEFFEAARGSLFGLYDMFAGGNLRRATIFALGIMPYISASIIIQLLGAVLPYFQKLQREGEEGRRKITQYTRYGTVLISAMQAFGTSLWLESLTTASGATVVPNPGVGFKLLTIITLTCGTIFIMWLGEQITERGIGNGISLIIFIGVIARLPGAILGEAQQFLAGYRNLISELLILAVVFVVVAAIVLVTRSQRKIPVHYGQKIYGRRMRRSFRTHIPLSVNTAGIIPIIFAQSIMFAPSTITTFFPNSEMMQEFAGYFQPNAVLYNIVYGLMIVFFAYFYTAIAVNPVDMADRIAKEDGKIPGVRPGKRTSDYIDRVLTRITLPGAIFFAIIAITPTIMASSFHVTFYFGGTGLLIVVGVALDTLQQIEAHLLERHYDGFMKRAKLKGRYA